MGGLKTFARRAFLIGSVAVAGGVAFGAYRYAAPYPNPLEHDLGPGAAALNPFLVIDAAGVTVITPRTELGQGAQSTLAALVAEELDLPWDEVRIAHGPVAPAYHNAQLLRDSAPFPHFDDGLSARTARAVFGVAAKLGGQQATGGSTSMSDAFERMRAAGASARIALTRAAAARWGVDPEGLRTEGGAVLDPASNARLRYAELAEAAADAPAPADPPLRPRSDWRLLGASLPRLDIPAKTTGAEVYAIDVALPDMLYASARMAPRFGAAPASLDPSAALAMPGVSRVLEIRLPGLGGGIAVIADGTWRAFQALDAVAVEWTDGPAYPATAEAAFDALGAAIDAGEADGALRDDGDADAALAAARAEDPARLIEAEYRVPYLAHAPLEPSSAAARYKDGVLEIWAALQVPAMFELFVRDVAGLSGDDRVVIHTLPAGGSFGRRTDADWALQAAQIAVAAPGRPVKLTPTREEDTRRDMYRPIALGRFAAALGADGRPTGLTADIASPSIIAHVMGRLGFSPPTADKLVTEGAFDQPYGLPAFKVTGYAPDLGVPIGFWRSVGASYNAFFLESFIDELAHAAGRDPVATRLELLAGHPRSRAVLARAAEMAAARPLARGDGPARGRGVAFCMSFGTPVAQIVDVADGPDGLRIERAFCAADVGVALDPANIEAQLVGGMIFGLSAAMSQEITFADGVVEQENFDGVPALRIDQCPEFEVAILEGGARPTGVGEPGTPPAAPALANAVFAATGRRVRRLPLSREVDFAG
ncbi:MAG: molybdopterin cofactor-binding domain-containing protein [Pseudomonadota bacterium]